MWGWGGTVRGVGGCENPRAVWQRHCELAMCRCRLRMKGGGIEIKTAIHRDSPPPLMRYIRLAQLLPTCCSTHVGFVGSIMLPWYRQYGRKSRIWGGKTGVHTNPNLGFPKSCELETEDIYTLEPPQPLPEHPRAILSLRACSDCYDSYS